MSQTVPINIGGHLSLGRDPPATVRWAAESGFGCLQTFVSSPGAWKPPQVDPREAAAFVHARRENDVDPLFIHAIYLINLASGDRSLVGRSKASLMATLRAGAALRASGVVTHVGSHLGRGYDQVAERVADALGEVLAATPHEVDLVLENSAGAGGIIGSSLPELGGLLQRADEHPRLKVALDTAHLCAAGWDFQEPGAAERLVRELDRQVGRERLVLVHANDSRAPCGSRKDRHANIGDGAIGLEGFRRLVAQPALQRVPWILETPDLDRRVEDLANLRALSVELLSTTVPSDKVKT